MKGLNAGRVIAAPENHLPSEQLRMQRRNFIRHGVAASALVGSAGVGAQAASATLVTIQVGIARAPVTTLAPTGVRR